VLLSGLLAAERDRIVERMAGEGFRFVAEERENEWWGGLWTRGRA
jgi:hypothetical protein